MSEKKPHKRRTSTHSELQKSAQKTRAVSMRLSNNLERHRLRNLFLLYIPTGRLVWTLHIVYYFLLLITTIFCIKLISSLFTDGSFGNEIRAIPILAVCMFQINRVAVSANKDTRRKE